MTAIIKLNQIHSALENIDVISHIEDGFIQYSKGNVVVPPVAELLFENPPGDTHIKYGYIKNEPYYCIKIASGFYQNSKLGISSSQGLMLLFSQKTGEPAAILLDEGRLTDIRTAAAGAVAARYFAPKEVKAIGILGTGIQGRRQLEYLQKVRPCKKVMIWDIDPTNAILYKKELGNRYDIEFAATPAQIAKNCNLIITTTPSQKPLLTGSDIRSGTHITAVGSDTPEKQELESCILKIADIVVADSLPQSETRGEIFRAVNDGKIEREKIVELGRAVSDKTLQRTDEKQITVADLTGVAVQDIKIASAVYSAVKNEEK
ncbi:MAG: ornithine cyclodeaminase family protein [Rhodothermaceae bacterium]